MQIEMEQEPFQLETPEQPVELKRDRRPHMPEPPPVRLVVIDDITLLCTTGLEVELDAFYVGLLQFEKDETTRTPIYHAENFSLRFEQHEGLVKRDAYRALQIEVRSLNETEHKLIDAEIEYQRQRGLMPGSDSLSLLDPAGNPVEIIEARGIM